MTLYRYIYYGVLELQLASVLHIGGNDEERFSLVTNGNGEFIIPATSFAGPVRQYLSRSFPEKTKDFFGSTEDDRRSRICIYDAVCKNVQIEGRKGIQLNAERGTAKDRALYEKHFLGEGLKTEVYVQAFLKDEHEFDELFQTTANGIAAHEIVFGANKTNGSGQFDVKSASYNVLDLKKPEDLNTYLSGVDLSAPNNAFCACSGKITVSKGAVMDDVYILKATVPNGLLVAGGDIGNKTVDKVNMHHQNKKTDVPFIPSSTIKGALRAYSKKAAAYLGIDKSIIIEIFGNEPGELESSANTKQRGKVEVNDCNIENNTLMVRNRIKIDRLLGSVMKHALMNQEQVYTSGNHTISIVIHILPGLEEKLRKTANAFVYLFLRDLGASRIAIGSNSSIGYGRLRGISLSVNGIDCNYKWDKDNFNPEIDISGCREMLTTYLDSLKGDETDAHE